MTSRLKEALERVQTLPEPEQDAIAEQILETLENEASWSRRLRCLPSGLRALAQEARDEHRRGETRPLDELVG